MATSFKGWGTSWGNSWGPISTNPNDMSASGGFVLTSTAQATALLFAQGSSSLSISVTGTLTAAAVSNDMVGAAAFTFSAIGILTDPNAYPERRPKSTNRLKLQKIREGRGFLVSSKSATRAHTARATSEHELPPVEITLPGHVRARGSRASTTGKPLRVSAGSRVPCVRATSLTYGWSARASGGSRAMLRSAASISMASHTTACGGARVGLQQAAATSSSERVVARGQRNLSDVEIAAAVRATIDKRRLSSTFL